MKKLKRIFVNRATIRNLLARNLFGFAAAGSIAAAIGSSAQAQIISDNFSNAPTSPDNVTQLPDNGVYPDGVNLPGGEWVSTGGNFYDSRLISSASGNYALGTVTSYASARNNGTSDGISVQSSGGYVEPSTLLISASINPIGPNSSTPPATVNLGFFSTSQSAQYTYGALQNFLGVQLSSTGVLEFDKGGTLTATGIAPGTGIFDSNGFTTLAFDESYNSGTNDTTISGITLDGVSYTGSYIASGDYLQFAGFQGSGGGFPLGNAITDFTVSDGAAAAVPEPSTYALLAVGVAALGGYQLRRRYSLRW
jgi:hypothetical protein